MHRTLIQIMTLLKNDVFQKTQKMVRIKGKKNIEKVCVDE